MAMEGKYRLTGWGARSVYVGALVCNDHTHPTFEEAQDCILKSLQTGRPEVVDDQAAVEGEFKELDG